MILDGKKTSEKIIRDISEQVESTSVEHSQIL